MADFYLDNDVAVKLATYLKSMGHEAFTARDLGLQTACDAEQLLTAATNKWILVTNNKNHFPLLQDAWLYWQDGWGLAHEHAGIIVCKHVFPDFMAKKLDELVRSGVDMANELFRFSEQPEEPWVRHFSPLD